MYFTLWDEAEEPGQSFWPILYVSLVIFFKCNGLSAFKSKNSSACTVKRFVLLCTAESRDMRNPSTCIAELSGVSKEERVRKKAHNPFILSWALFGWLQTCWNQMSRLCYTDKLKNWVLDLLAAWIYPWVSIVENQSTDCTILGESLLLGVGPWWLHGMGNQRSIFVQYLRGTRKGHVLKSVFPAVPRTWTVGLYTLQLLCSQKKRSRTAVSCVNHSLLLFQAWIKEDGENIICSPEACVPYGSAGLSSTKTETGVSSQKRAGGQRLL